MLLTLRIRDLVIVEELAVEFGPGLNVLTGETGAGKSILVEALCLLAGVRADRSAIRSGARRATVEALFEPGPDRAVFDWLGHRGLGGDGETEQLLVHREIAASGSGRVLVNGSPCTVALLRELGRELLELHGQHEQQGLLSPERHLELLDAHSGAGGDATRVAGAFRAVMTARERLRLLREESVSRAERQAELERITGEIDALKPRSGELEQLDRERRILRSAGRMAELLDGVVGLVYDGEPNAGSLSAVAAGQAEELGALDPVLEEPARRLREATVELQDIGSVIRDYRDRAVFDPARLDEIEERQVALDRLCLRHGVDEAGLLRLRDEARASLDSLEGMEQELERTAGELTRFEAEYVRAATTLAHRRRKGARSLARAVEGQLAYLALEKARFEIEFRPASGETLTDGAGSAVALHLRGAERAEFRLAANPGEPFRPLQQVASGGELSRVMLALHVIAERAAAGRVLVFDEVDTGVGGAVADAVGARLARLAARQQVICVTHLPQVAAHGQSHFRVSKSSRAGRTTATVNGLDDGGRVEELARMLAGKKSTAASREHAAELLGIAGRRAPKRERRKA